jgi:uncharacterized protein YrrD
LGTPSFPHLFIKLTFIDGGKMRISRLSLDMQGFQIVSTTNGQIIGRVEDLLINMQNLKIAAAVTSKGGLFDSKIEAVQRKDILVWGDDVILVSDSDVIYHQNNIKGFEEWESAADQINGKDVLNTDGDKIAELNDVVVDSTGHIVGYDLSKVFIEGPIGESKRIHVNATQALGDNALIIDTAKLYAWEM